MKRKILGLITARGGSKGIPGKNIKPLLGKPLIAHTIEVAQESGVFDRIILSTDDKEIARVGRAYGAEVPFMRPKKFAGDTASHLPVFLHALSWLRKHEQYEPDYVMLLQPTSPLRRAHHIREALALLEQSDADSVISVTKVPEAYHSRKTMQISEDGHLRTLLGEPVYKRIPRRQDLPEEYTTAGLVILLFKPHLLFGENPNFYGERTLPYILEEKYFVDINEPEDWPRAEEALKKLQ